MYIDEDLKVHVFISYVFGSHPLFYTHYNRKLDKSCTSSPTYVGEEKIL